MIEEGASRIRARQDSACVSSASRQSSPLAVDRAIMSEGKTQVNFRGK